MKLGIGLRTRWRSRSTGELMLDWARLADEAGLEVLGTIDKPNYDSWDPLVTLAGVAGVTERIGLATTILQLPPRNEVLVSMHAAVVDQLSAGRLTLGLSQGGREDDYELLGAQFKGRSERFERQVNRVREIWEGCPRVRPRPRRARPRARCRTRRPRSGRRIDAEVDRARGPGRGRVPLRHGRLGHDDGARPGVRETFAGTASRTRRSPGSPTSRSATTRGRRSTRRRTTSCATTAGSGPIPRTSSTTGLPRRSPTRSRPTPTRSTCSSSFLRSSALEQVEQALRSTPRRTRRRSAG